MAGTSRAAGALTGACLAAAMLAAGQVLGQADPKPAGGDLSRPPTVTATEQGRAADEPPPPNVSAAELMANAREDVRIIARENHTVQEYSVNNNVYKIKVTPRNAPPYYLTDEDGSGNFQWKRGPDLERTEVPQWAIFKW